MQGKQLSSMPVTKANDAKRTHSLLWSGGKRQRRVARRSRSYRIRLNSVQVIMYRQHQLNFSEHLVDTVVDQEIIRLLASSCKQENTPLYLFSTEV